MPTANVPSAPRSSLAWERFWRPRTGSIALDWSGYIIDPRSRFTGSLQPDLVQSNAFEEIPCVVLLGEPGMGKSHELRQILRGEPLESGAILRDLRHYDSTGAIQDDLFRSDEFRTWVAGSETLTLGLDSLDEALLEIGPLASWLVEQLRRYPAARLKLRIACRTAEWPRLVEEALVSIWGDDNVRVFILAPLTAADVKGAAEARGIDPAAFFEEVARHDATALANTPTTLRFLLDVFSRHEALPQTKTELYRVGCQHLCEEDEERRISRRAGSLTALERLSVARRIASATIFGNRAAIWRGDAHLAPSAEVAVPDLIGGTEPVRRDHRISVMERELTEVLGTALFSVRGESSIAWTHQTYAEFLAAEWVAENGLSMPQIDALIRHAGDDDRQLVPQLRETISWLAGIHTGVRSLVLDTEPELLLKSDSERLSDSEKAALIDALLRSTDSYAGQNSPGRAGMTALNMRDSTSSFGPTSRILLLTRTYGSSRWKLLKPREGQTCRKSAPRSHSTAQCHSTFAYKRHE